MRLIKMLGLAAVAAVAAMAFVGASSAMATSTLLCTNNTDLTGTNCTQPATVGFLSVEEVSHPTKDGKGTLLNEDLNVKCNALLTGTVLQGLVTNGPVIIHVAANELTYSSCTFPCTVTTIQGGLISTLKTGPELAEITATGFIVRVNCVGIIDCDYDGANLIGHGFGPTVLGTNGKGHVTYLGNPVNIREELGSVGCPPVGKLDALFQSKTPLYVRG